MIMNKDQRYYQRNREKIAAKYQAAYADEAKRAILIERRRAFRRNHPEKERECYLRGLLRDSPCIGNCGRGTTSTSGYCNDCKKPCTLCQKTLRPRIKGQTQHKRCPKDRSET